MVLSLSELLSGIVMNLQYNVKTPLKKFGSTVH